MLYRIVVHAPAEGATDDTLARVRAVLHERGLDVRELRVEPAPHPPAVPVLYFETTLEGPSAYHLTVATGPSLFAGLFGDAGLTVSEEHVVVEAVRTT